MRRVLCFGDSNTYGYKPDGSGRFSENIRWTGRLKTHLQDLDFQVIEEGLVGRTTVFEDSTRIGRKGSSLFPVLLESHNPLDLVIIMLGTNDCKTVYQASPKVIGRGVEILLKQAKNSAPQAKILLISPIHLGEHVWEENYDTEFNQISVTKSKELKGVYQELAEKYGSYFLAASDVADPSEEDQEHMDEKGHASLEKAIFQKITKEIFQLKK